MGMLSKVDIIWENINIRAALYPLPPHFLLIHSSTEKSADLYLSYVRIRPTLLSILTRTGDSDQSVWRRLRDWKKILHGDKLLALHPNTIVPVAKRINSSTPPDSTKELLPDREDMIDIPPAKRQRIDDDDATRTSMRFGYEIEPFDRSKKQYWLGKPVSTDTINRTRKYVHKFNGSYLRFCFNTSSMLSMKHFYHVFA